MQEFIVCYGLISIFVAVFYYFKITEGTFLDEDTFKTYVSIAFTFTLFWGVILVVFFFGLLVNFVLNGLNPKK